MKIAISGNAGSGKSTVATLLANKLGYKRIEMGDFYRTIAKEKGISLPDLNTLCEKSPEIDKDIDKKIEYLGKTEDNFVIVSRIAYHWIPDSIKIFLDVDPKIGADRIFKDKSDLRSVEKTQTLEEAVKSQEERKKSEIERYEKYYGVNPYDLSHYGLLINTSEMTPQEVVDTIVDFLNLKE